MKFAKLTAFSLALCMAVGAVPFVENAFPAITARAEAKTGSCGENASYVWENGIMTISGEGVAVADVSVTADGDGSKSGRKLIIEEGITELRFQSGYRTSPRIMYFSEIDIPASLSKITYEGDEVFYRGCFRDVVDFNVAEGNPVFCSYDGVVYSADGSTLVAYPDYRDFKFYDVPSGVTSILKSAFQNNDYLEEVTLPDGLENIGRFAFDDCDALKKAVLPNGLKNIEDYAFNYCDELKTVILPETLQTIGVAVFSNCVNLEEITTPRYEGSGLNYIPESVTAIADSAFLGTLIDDISISGNLQTMGLQVFSYCKNLKAVVCRSGMTEINERAFSNCTALEKVTLSDTMQTIGVGAFQNCTSLRSIVIPPSMKSIGTDAFKRDGDNIIIRGEKGTYAERYAKGMGYIFKPTLALDANGDGKISLLDFIAIKKAVHAQQVPSANYDVNDDGVVNVVDMALLLHELVNGK